MRELSDIINYATAPLSQWELPIGEPVSAGKKQEDLLTHAAIASELHLIGAEHVTGLIADEARFEINAAALLPNVKSLTHLTMNNSFAAVARGNLAAAQQHASMRSDFVRVTTDVDSIVPGSQDAVVMNMILGCLATAEDHDNLHKMLCFVGTLLKPQGALIIVRPNPAGGEFSTYKCVTSACDLKAGEDYLFTVDGVEGELKNLHTPNGFLKQKMQDAGFNVSPTLHIWDKPRTDSQAPFLLNVCRLQ